MKKIITLFALVLILVSSNSALALTPYQLAAAMLSSTNATCIDLTTDLSIADKGTKPDEVRKLQTFLYPKYLTEPATGYFGVLTDAAVKKLQAEYPNEIEKPTGYVGALTRGIIKSLTCGNSQASATGAKAARDTVASAAPTYTPGAWWLVPPATGAGVTDPSEPVKANTQGNNTTPTSTSTPPTDCSKYTGVIPGETKKVKVDYLRFNPIPRLKNLSAEARHDFDLITGKTDGAADVGYNFIDGFWVERIPSGVALVQKIKTTEYNSQVIHMFSTVLYGSTPDGKVAISVSECPADFTSPPVVKNCLAIGAPVGTRVDFGVLMPNNSCNLDPNKTYYLNVTSGFAGGNEETVTLPYNGGERVVSVPYIGNDGSGTQAREMSLLLNVYHALSGNGPGKDLDIIKNRSAYYDEIRRIREDYDRRSREYSSQCQSLKAAYRAAHNGQSDPQHNECSSLQRPAPYWQ